MSQMIFRVHANCEADVDELNILLSQGWTVERTVQWPSFEWTDKVFEKHVCEPCVDYILEIDEGHEPMNVRGSQTGAKAIDFDIEQIEGAMHNIYVRALLRFDNGSTESSYFNNVPDACDWIKQHGLDPKLKDLN